jgi:hypothetical protein
MGALNDMEGEETGNFNVLFAKKFMAMDATIIGLQTTLIQVLNAICGGSRFEVTGEGANRRVVDRGSQYPGFCLDKDGKLKASNAEIGGHIEAETGYFKGNVEMSMPMLGSTTPVPLIGGLRAWVSSEQGGGGTYLFNKSDNIDFARKEGTGVFSIKFKAEYAPGRPLYYCNFGYASTINPIVDWQTGSGSMEFGNLKEDDCRYFVRTLNGNGTIANPQRFYIMWFA